MLKGTALETSTCDMWKKGTYEGSSGDWLDVLAHARLQAANRALDTDTPCALHFLRIAFVR